MASLAVLVLATLLGNLPVIQSRPRQQGHGKIYDELKPVPFVDSQDITGSSEWPKLSNTLDSYEQYYNKYNKDHDRDLDSATKDTDTDTDTKQVLDIIPVEGGTEDMTTHTEIPAEVKPDKPRKRHHRHHGDKKARGNKKAEQAVQDDVDQKQEESDFEGIGFNLEKFYKEHPDFKENVATILDSTQKPVDDGDVEKKNGSDDNSNHKEDDDDDDESDNVDDEAAEDDSEEINEDEVEDSNDIENEEESNDDEEDEDSADDEDNDIDDDDDKDEEESDDSEGEESEDVPGDIDDPEKESHDLSSEEFEEYYDYYDELDDSSYSSSEQEAERLGNQLFDTNWYDRMFGDQPAASEEDKKNGTSEVKEDLQKTSSVKKDLNDKSVTDLKLPEIKTEIEATVIAAEGKKDENIPKTDIEPSTSPNPPTPKKDLKSTVTQPVYPQQKSMLETWNYIESTPIEACQTDANCSAGRMCMFGLCLCGQPDFCEGHNKPVCGSDGRLYKSHCELHRTACVLKVHIRIDFSMSCMPKQTPDKKVDPIVPADATMVQTTKMAVVKDTQAADTSMPQKQDLTLLADSLEDSLDTSEDDNNLSSEDTDIDLDNAETKTAVKDTAESAIAIGLGKELVGDRVDDSSESAVDSEKEDFDLSLDSNDVDVSFDSDEKNSESAEPEKPKAVAEIPKIDLYKDSEETVSEDVSEEMKAGQVEENSVDVDLEKDSKEEEEKESSSEGQSLVPWFCTPDIFMQFKADVLQYHCIFFNEPNCDRQTQEGKHKLAELMFNYFDKNYNGVIENEELWEMQLIENMDQLSTLCTLLDIITFDDLGERDNRLTADEFIQAFDIPDLLEHRTEIVPLLATIGNGLEAKCDVTDSEDIVWKRNGVDLSLLDFPGISVLGDGSLYLETIGFHHVGNLTCYDRKKPSIRQIHMLTVQKPPHVIVSPQRYDGDLSDITLHCHAEGYPRPSVEWQFQGKAVTLGAKYYIHPHDNSLTIMKVDPVADSGDYRCVGKNEAGASEAVATVKVHGPNDTAHSSSLPAEETFLIFHDDGYTMHDPADCATQRHVKPDFGNFYFIPDELDAPPSLCEAGGLPCMWGGAVSVRDRFVYASQPRENRVIVIDVQDTFNPNQVIFTDKAPVALYYVEHLDEVWVVCWNGNTDTGAKTVVVIRNASQKTQHHAVHTQPIGNRFDVVNDVFLPPSSELHHPYKFGYTVHTGQQGMFKVDLAQKKYMKAVDLTKYNCVPQNMAFVPLGGHVLIQCTTKPSQQGLSPAVLVLDYITDTVLGNLSVSGTPYVSPDVSKVIVVNQHTGKIAVFKITENGEIIKEFDVTVGAVVKGAVFHKASYNQGYDVYLTSAEKPTVLSVSLENGKVDETKDVGEPDSAMYLAFFKQTRPLVSGDVFSDFLITTATSSAVIVDSTTHKIQCDFRDLQNPAVVSYAHLERN